MGAGTAGSTTGWHETGEAVTPSGDHGGMFDELAGAIDALQIDVDEAELAAVVALRDRLDAKLAMAAASFDAAELWDSDGSVSMAAWLRAHAGMTQRDAARLVATGRRLRGCPRTAEAWAAGEITGGAVLTRGVDYDGGWAQYAVSSAATVVPIPDTLSFEQACFIPDAVSTPWAAITATAGASPGSVRKVAEMPSAVITAATWPVPSYTGAATELTPGTSTSLTCAKPRFWKPRSSARTAASSGSSRW